MSPLLPNAAALLERGTLFTQADRLRFDELESELVALANRAPVYKRDIARSTVFSLREQAAWLFIEHQFETNPSLEALDVGIEKEGENIYIYVTTQREGDEDFNELGGDPEGLDEQIQMYLNDMGRNSHAGFHALLAQQSLYRDELDEASKAMFGEEWAAERLAQRLDTGLEQPSTRSNAPRM